LAAFAACSGRPFAVLGEIAGIAFRTTPAVTAFTALSAGLGRALAVMSKVAGAVLATDVAGARRLLAILGKIAGIPRMPLFGHGQLLLGLQV